jgi:flap endonuclease-1
MGIRSLNKYLCGNCSISSIKKISIEDMSNKTIVIDTSIYIYKYLKQNDYENGLENSFIKLIESFIKYNIHPIFVFDGKSPSKKSNLRKERSQIKKNAELEYDKLKSQGESNMKLKELQNKFIRVKQEDIIMLKALMKRYNIDAIQAEWEADAICANYVKSGVAWACLSDDMDMLVYGCCRVIREFSLADLCGQIYILPSILKDLRMSMRTFRDIMVVSGTDYNRTDKSIVTLNKTLVLYNRYLCSNPRNNITFYNWLLDNTDYINDYQELMDNYEIFCGKSSQN